MKTTYHRWAHSIRPTIALLIAAMTLTCTAAHTQQPTNEQTVATEPVDDTQPDASSPVSLTINGVAFDPNDPNFSRHLDGGSISMEDGALSLHDAILRRGGIQIRYKGDPSTLAKDGYPFIIRLEGKNLIEMPEDKIAIEGDQYIALEIKGGDLTVRSSHPTGTARAILSKTITLGGGFYTLDGGIEAESDIILSATEMHITRGGITCGEFGTLALASCAIVPPLVDRSMFSGAIPTPSQCYWRTGDAAALSLHSDGTKIEEVTTEFVMNGAAFYSAH